MSAHHNADKCGWSSAALLLAIVVLFARNIDRFIQLVDVCTMCLYNLDGEKVSERRLVRFMNQGAGVNNDCLSQPKRGQLPGSHPPALSNVFSWALANIYKDVVRQSGFEAMLFPRHLRLFILMFGVPSATICPIIIGLSHLRRRVKNRDKLHRQLKYAEIDIVRKQLTKGCQPGATDIRHPQSRTQLLPGLRPLPLEPPSIRYSNCDA